MYMLFFKGERTTESKMCYQCLCGYHMEGCISHFRDNAMLKSEDKCLRISTTILHELI